MRKQIQEPQAAAFIAHNQVKVDLIHADLLVGAELLINRCTVHPDLNADLMSVLADAKTAMSESELAKLFSILRWNAAMFTRLQGMSPIYWEWIDAYGSYSDACGTYWPYMTLERRSTLMEWAEEGITKVKAVSH